MADDIPLSSFPPKLQPQVPLGTIAKAGQTVDPTDIYGQMQAMPGQVANAVGNVTGVNDAINAVRGNMTPEEAQMFALGALPALIGGPEAKAAEEAVPLASKAIREATSLPMDEASRMARAVAQNRTIDAYHGTRSPQEITEFQTGDIYDDNGELLHPFSRDPNALIGPHFAKEPSVANKFAEGNFDWLKTRFTEGDPAVYPVKLDSTNVHKFGSEDELNNFVYSHNISTPEVDSIIENDHDGDIDAGSERYENDPEYRHQVNRKAVLNENGYDEPSSETAQALGDAARSDFNKRGVTTIQYPNAVEGGTSYISLAPVRSRFATFDPSKKDSGHILAGAAGLLGGAGGAAMTQKQPPLSSLQQ